MNSSICTAAMANIVISQQSPNLISNALRHSCVRLGVAVTEISALQTWNGWRDFYWASLMMLNLTWPTPLWSDSTDHLNILELRNWALRILEKNMIHIQELPGNGLSERTVTSFHWSHHLESTHSSSWHQQSQLFCLVHPKKNTNQIMESSNETMSHFNSRKETNMRKEEHPWLDNLWTTSNFEMITLVGKQHEKMGNLLYKFHTHF